LLLNRIRLKSTDSEGETPSHAIRSGILEREIDGSAIRGLDVELYWIYCVQIIGNISGVFLGGEGTIGVWRQ